MSGPKPRCEEGAGEVAEPAPPNPSGSDRSHGVSKIGSKQARGPRGEGWGQGQEDAGGLEPSERPLRTQALCQGGLGGGKV